MLESISWSSYLILLAFITLAYYGWLYLKYFRPYMSHPSEITGGAFSSQSPAKDSSAETDHALYQPKPAALQVPVMYTGMLDEMEAFMEAASQDKSDKRSFLNGLQTIAEKYGAIEDIADRILLVQIILQKGRSDRFMDLSDEEVEGIWKGA